MAVFALDLDEDTVGILLQLGDQMKLQHLSTIEVLELVITQMADSIDSQMELRPAETGSPVEMQDAIDAIMNPDISLEFKQPRSLDAVVSAGGKITFEQLQAAGFGKDITDPVLQEATTAVLNQLDREEWNAPYVAELIERTYRMLSEKIA